MNVKNLLSEVIYERMKTKSELDKLRFLTEAKGNRYESIINILLDKLNNLKKLENELNEELKKRKQ